MKKLKTLENKTVSLNVGTSKIEKTYAELAKDCMGNSPAQGITISEMRQRLRVLDAIEKANGTIELEPSDLAVFKKVVSEMTWVLVSHGIVEFVNDVESIK